MMNMKRKLTQVDFVGGTAPTSFVFFLFIEGEDLDFAMTPQRSTAITSTMPEDPDALVRATRTPPSA
jgi:hypothetical protein